MIDTEKQGYLFLLKQEFIFQLFPYPPEAQYPAYIGNVYAPNPSDRRWSFLGQIELILNRGDHCTLLSSKEDE